MTIRRFAALPLLPAVFDAFSVVLRESAELLLILGALVASLRSAQGARWLPWVAAGAVAGCAAGAGFALWLVSAHIDPRWAAGLTFVLALGVLVLVSTLLAAQGAIRAHVQALVEKWLERPSAPLWLLAIQMMLGALAEYLALAAPTSAWARHLEALAAPVLPQGRWFGAFCAVLMVPPVAYILRCWWRESGPRV